MSEPELRRFHIDSQYAQQRADRVLSELTGLSRSAVAKIIDSGQAYANNLELRRSDLVTAGDVVEIEIPPPRVYEPEVTPVEGLRIIYDDSDLVVVDKPAGVAAHTGPGWQGPTVVGALRAAGYRISTSGPVEREGIVHRLDVGTSGLMVVAKSEIAYSRLKNDFRYRRVQKFYHALVQGYLEQDRGSIEAPIGRHRGRDFRMTVSADGKPSITHYETLEVVPGATLVRVRLETGRTHQIRVHFSALRHPCVGDPLYGADPTLAVRCGLERQWLHAVELGFSHPVTSSPMSFESPYPPDLLQALQELRV